jgi:hypothetical protein
MSPTDARRTGPDDVRKRHVKRETGMQTPER